MSRRKVIWTVFLVVIAIGLGSLVGVASYQSGYQRGQDDVRQTIQKETWEGAAYEKLEGDLGMSMRALMAIARNPEAFTAEEREYWREQARFSISMLEEGLLPKLDRGETVVAYGDPMDPAPIRRLLQRVKRLLERVPA
jgi:hypothetical protein